MGSLSQNEDKKNPLPVHDAPIVFSYNNRIRPLLDTVDKLRQLNIMQEGIQLPTIVVVGDQSSGKSSVLESLAGISLPRGEGTCTRVPLIMRLQNHQSPQPQLSLEFNGKSLPSDEAKISDDIVLATEEIAGNEKGISNTPLTLIVKKKGVPDLTMIDLPGITRVATSGQPENICEQICEIIMHYITPEESIILNVLSAGQDFSTNESIVLSRRVDTTGQRTLAVVTKCDKEPDKLLEKVTKNDVNIGLGYVCVRNRIGDESYEQARAEESRLFQTHPELSKINKSIVGCSVLAEKLMKIQSTTIAKCLPEIVSKITNKLSASVDELNNMPKRMSSVSEAMAALVNILSSVKESLRKLLLLGEFDEYPHADDMHSTARLVEMLNKFSEDMQSASVAGKDSESTKNFLLDEIKILEETKSIALPNLPPKSAFRILLHNKVVAVSAIPFDCLEKLWSYIQTVVTSVMLRHCENYPQIISCTRRAVQNLIARKKQESIDWMKDLVEMEKFADYTCNPQYISSCNELLSQQDVFMKKINNLDKFFSTISRFGEIDIRHLHSHKGVVLEAFDLKMRMTAYWDIVLRRIVDNLALHLLFSIRNLVNKEMQSGIINELIGPQSNGLERMLEESPFISEKRNNLTNSIMLLKESKDLVAGIMDRVDLEIV